MSSQNTEELLAILHDMAAVIATYDACAEDGFPPALPFFEEVLLTYGAVTQEELQSLKSLREVVEA